MKKIFKSICGLFMCCMMLLTTACGKSDDKDNGTSKGCTENPTVEDINKMLNGTLNMDEANPIAIIPFNHVNGPRNEWKFYALVNFVYRDRVENYVKYQVTYLSCTCRTADVNYWQTAYMELTIPESENAEESVLQKLSFDRDGTGHYTAGFWGDSSPIYSGDKIVATFEKTANPDGGYYPSIREDYIPLLIGKTKAELDQYNFVDDLKTANVMDQETFDAFSGASVSTNNILRILHAVFNYHADRYFG